VCEEEEEEKRNLGVRDDDFIAMGKSIVSNSRLMSEVDAFGDKFPALFRQNTHTIYVQTNKTSLIHNE
jgi:hypothetical protein